MIFATKMSSADKVFAVNAVRNSVRVHSGSDNEKYMENEIEMESVLDSDSEVVHREETKNQGDCDSALGTRTETGSDEQNETDIHLDE